MTLIWQQSVEYIQPPSTNMQDILLSPTLFSDDSGIVVMSRLSPITDLQVTPSRSGKAQ